MSEPSHFRCPGCKEVSLDIIDGLEVMPQGIYQEASVQICKCNKCGFTASATYEESRAGRLGSEIVHHYGCQIENAQYEMLEKLIESCPDSSNKKCGCAGHNQLRALYEQRGKGPWEKSKPEIFPVEYIPVNLGEPCPKCKTNSFHLIGCIEVSPGDEIWDKVSVETYLCKGCGFCALVTYELLGEEDSDRAIWRTCGSEITRAEYDSIQGLMENCPEFYDTECTCEGHRTLTEKYQREGGGFEASGKMFFNLVRT